MKLRSCRMWQSVATLSISPTALLGRDGPGTRTRKLFCRNRASPFSLVISSPELKRVMIKCCRDDSFPAGHASSPFGAKLPANSGESRLKVSFSIQQRDGPMTVDGNGGSSPNYEPHSQGGSFQCDCWRKEAADAHYPVRGSCCSSSGLHWRTPIPCRQIIRNSTPKPKTCWSLILAIWLPFAHPIHVNWLISKSQCGMKRIEQGIMSRYI